VRTPILLLTLAANGAFSQKLTLENCIRLAQAAPSTLTLREDPDRYLPVWIDPGAREFSSAILRRGRLHL